MKNIVIIGGGTGTSTLLKGLKKYPANLSVIVSTADDGGSTGRLRKELGVLPPGDIRQCVVALSQKPKMAEEFNFRYSAGPFKGHTVGNLILANLEKQYGVNTSLAIVSEALKVKGQVLPVTLKPTILSAVLENGKKLVGEHNIDVPEKRAAIKTISLSPNLPVNPKIVQALHKADAIVLGPGDLFTSVLPSLLVKGVKEAMDKSSAKKVLVGNIMTQPGQTDSYSPLDFVEVVNKYLGKKKLDTVLVNTKKPAAKVLADLKKQGALFIFPKVKDLTGIKVVKADLVDKTTHKKAKGDVLNRSLLRHDSHKLAKLIWGLV